MENEDLLVSLMDDEKLKKLFIKDGIHLREISKIKEDLLTSNIVDKLLMVIEVQETRLSHLTILSKSLVRALNSEKDGRIED